MPRASVVVAVSGLALLVACTNPNDAADAGADAALTAVADAAVMDAAASTAPSASTTSAPAHAAGHDAGAGKHAPAATDDTWDIKPNDACPTGFTPSGMDSCARICSTNADCHDDHPCTAGHPSSCDAYAKTDAGAKPNPVQPSVNCASGFVHLTDMNRCLRPCGANHAACLSGTTCQQTADSKSPGMYCR